MQSRSRTVEMPSGLSLPLAFGMNTRLIGSGRYVSCLSASASSASHRSTPPPHALRCPQENDHVERRIGSIRRECLDHVVEVPFPQHHDMVEALAEEL
jgi:hypothetical protein